MAKELNNLTPENVTTTASERRERTHRREYESALEVAGVKGPPWEDLTEQQRENIRKANQEYWQEMQDFGESLRAGYS
jgi:hypothetical protein